MTRNTTLDIATLGRRLRDKTVAALALSAVLPVTVTAYIVQAHVRPALDPSDTARFWAVHLLLLFTLLGVVAGGYVIWTVARAIGRIASLAPSQSAGDSGEDADDLGRLVASLGVTLSRGESQAKELDSITARFVVVEQELAAAKSRLRDRERAVWAATVMDIARAHRPSGALRRQAVGEADPVLPHLDVEGLEVGLEQAGGLALVPPGGD